MDKRIPEASSYNYLGIIWSSDLSWADQINYTVQRGGKALHFITCVLKKGNSKKEILACTSIVRPFLEYGASCWYPYRENQIKALDSVQKKANKFANHTNDSMWSNLAQRRKIDHIRAPFKAYTGERACKGIRNELQGPCYLSKDDHDRNIWVRKQRTDIGKCSFVYIGQSNSGTNCLQRR